MTTADQLAIINKLLQAPEEAHALAQAGLVVDWVKSKRIVVLVRREKEESLMLITCKSQLPLSNVKDIAVDTAVAVDGYFKFDLDSGHNSGPDAVYITVTSRRQKFLLEMLPGYHTQNFVSEMYRLIEGLKETDTSSFTWLSKYNSHQMTDPSSPDTPVVDTVDTVPRMELAQGTAQPIVGRDRESVVIYQMATKEDQFTQLQELDLSSEAFLFSESVKEEEWMKAVTSSLHEGAEYTLLKHVRLVGMLLMVYSRTDLADQVTNISVDSVGTGIMGKLGNKGGVGVRLRIHATDVCLVNSHLAAHVKEFERRNQDYNDICSRMTFSQFERPCPDSMPMFQAKRIKDHDMIFWLGDLNYRLGDLDCQEVKDLLKEDNLKNLLDQDQFMLQRNQRRVFVGYTEGQITFPPTYKYDPGTSDWDSSEKSRPPAWTDRILWMGENVFQTSYRSHMSLTVSDHKPVSATFRAGIRVIDRVKRQKIKEDIMKKLDMLENDFLPQVMVDKTDVIFDEVRFLEPIKRSLAIANTGQVPVSFEFIKKPGETNYAKSWLQAEPSSGFIMPGEKADVGLEVYVDKKTAHFLNSGHDQLYDILVLHLLGGKDIFITVSGTYTKSCFGSSISALVQLTVPIRELSPGEVVHLEAGDTQKLPTSAVDGESKEPYPVPKELWFLCDIMSSLGLAHENLFLQPGMRQEILTLRDWLDTGLPLERPQVSIHSAAETLLTFLESLREPIVPYSLFNRCLECSANYLQCKQLASHLPPTHKHVFDYLTAFLREVVSHSAKNGIDSKILATLFCNLFLRDPPGTNYGTGIRAKTTQQMSERKKAAFIHHFLVNEADD